MNFQGEQNSFRLDQSMSSDGLFTIIERKPLSSLENGNNMNVSQLNNSLSTSNTFTPPKKDDCGMTDNICELYRLNTSKLLNDTMDVSTGGKINFVDDDVSSFFDSERNEDELFLDDDISTLDSNYSLNSPIKNNSPKKLRGSIILNRNRNTSNFYEDEGDEENRSDIFIRRNGNDITNDELYEQKLKEEKAIRLNKNIYRIDNVDYDEQNRKENVIKKVKQIRNSMISEHESEEGSDMGLGKGFKNGPKGKWERTEVEEEEQEEQEDQRHVFFKNLRKSEKELSKYNDEETDFNNYDNISRYNSDKKIKYRTYERVRNGENDRLSEHELKHYGSQNEDYPNGHVRHERDEENYMERTNIKFLYGHKTTKNFKDPSRKSFTKMKSLDYQKSARMDEYGIEKVKRKDCFEKEGETLELNETEEERDEVDGELTRKITRGGSHLIYDTIRKSKVNMHDNIMHRKSRREFDTFYIDGREQKHPNERIEKGHLAYYNTDDDYYENSFHRREKEDSVQEQYLMRHEGKYALPKKMHTRDNLYNHRNEEEEEYEQKSMDVLNRKGFPNNKNEEFISNELNEKHSMNPYFYKTEMSKNHMPHPAEEEMLTNEDGAIYYKTFSKKSLKHTNNENYMDSNLYMNKDKILSTKEKEFLPYDIRHEDISDDPEYIHRIRNKRNTMRNNEILTNNNYAGYENYHTIEKEISKNMSLEEKHADTDISAFNDLSQNRNGSLQGLNRNRSMVDDDELFYVNGNVGNVNRQHNMYSENEEGEHEYHHYPQHVMYRKKHYNEPGMYNRNSYEHLQRNAAENRLNPAVLRNKSMHAYRNTDNDEYENEDGAYYYNNAHTNSNEHMDMHYENERNYSYENPEIIGEMKYEEGGQLTNGQPILRKDSHGHFHRDHTKEGHSYEHGEEPYRYNSFETPPNYLKQSEMPKNEMNVERGGEPQQVEAKQDEIKDEKKDEQKEEKIDEQIGEKKETLEKSKSAELQEGKGTNETVTNEEQKINTIHTSNEKAGMENTNIEQTQNVETPKEGVVNTSADATATAVNTETSAVSLQQTLPVVTPSNATPLVTTPPVTTPPVTTPPVTTPPITTPPITTPPVTTPPTVTPETATPPVPAAPVKRRRGRPKLKKGNEETLPLETQSTLTTGVSSANIGTNVGAGIMTNNTMMHQPLSHNLTSNFNNVANTANATLNHMNTVNTIMTDLNQPLYNGINANFNAGIPVNMNQINNMNQLNQVNQLNQLNQLEQINQLKQIDQINQLNQLNQLKQMDQLNQLNAMDPMNQHLNNQINPTMNQQIDQLNMHMNVHPQFNQPMFNNTNAPLNHSVFAMPNRMHNMGGANIQGNSNDEQYHMYNNNVEFDNEIANNNNMNQDYYINVNKINNTEDYPYDEDGENRNNEHMMNGNDMGNYNNNNINEEYVNYKHSNKRSVRSAVSGSEERDSQGGYTEDHSRRGRKKKREMEQMEEHTNMYEDTNFTELQNNGVNNDSQKEDQKEGSGYSTFVDENNKKASYKVAYHPADAIWEKVSGVKFGPMILTAQSRTTNVILSKKRSIELGNILQNLIYGYIYKGDNVRLTIGKESRNVMCGSAFFLPSFMDCSIHNDDDSGSAKLFLCFVYLNSS